MHQADELSAQNNTLAYTWFVEILQNKNPNWPVTKTNNTSLEERVIQTGLQHGVLSLCTYLLFNTPAWNTIPEAFRNQLKNSIRQETVSEMAKSYELKNVLDLLAQKDIQPLLLKGAPLSYSHYLQPYLRSRCDTDLLFPNKQSADNAWQLLQEIGYSRPNTVSGDLVSYEFACSKTDKFGFIHTLDCHWAISNNQLFACRLPFQELKEHAITVLDIADHALAPDNIHALLLACMHRFAHKPYGDAGRLIWLYDIHLLVSSLSQTQWDQFISWATEKKICNICLDGLQETTSALATPIADDVKNALYKKGKMEDVTASMGDTQWRMALLDFQALPGWQKRLRLLREHLFPSSEYILEKYRTDNHLLLPFLYILRGLQGITKRFH